MSENFEPRFLTVKEASKVFPFSESSLRYLIFNSQQNGLNKSLRRIGKKILISYSAFEQWIDSHKEIAR